MDFLWQNCGDTQENQKMQAQTADFLRIKDACNLSDDPRKQQKLREVSFFF